MRKKIKHNTGYKCSNKSLFKAKIISYEKKKP